MTISAHRTRFMPIYSILQSSLHLDCEYRRRQLLCIGAYLALSVVGTGLAYVLPTMSPARAAALGAILPGAGFLNWAVDGQIALAFALFAASLMAFAVALLVWFGTGNLIAPLAIWSLAAWLASEPALFELEGARVAVRWPMWIGPAVSLMLLISWLCSARRRSPPRSRPAGPVRSMADTAEPEELSREDLSRIRLLLDRALQPVERFDGFERRDQFQTAATRYQVNFLSYALALVGLHHAPAADDPFAKAQQLLLTKLGDRRLWKYWRLENAWGNLRFGADPVVRQNIMYSGFGALQMALGGADTLVLHDRGTEWRRYELDGIVDLLENQYRTSAYGLLGCEPHWIYPLCNLITMVGIKASDTRCGTSRWSGLADTFLRSLEREGMTADGRFIAFRSALTGFAPPAPGGIVMQAFPCLFLNALAPEQARACWEGVRHRLNSASWKRLFWPIDTGNYGFSRASSYAATAAAAVEMGDCAVAEECLRRLEAECPSREIDGTLHRERASLWAHALEIMARSGRRDGLRNAVASMPRSIGPRLTRISCSKALVGRARCDGAGIELVLEPGGGALTPSIELAGLQPNAYYQTGLARWPTLKSDNDGRAVVRVPLAARTALSIRPFASQERQWSAV